MATSKPIYLDGAMRREIKIPMLRGRVQLKDEEAVLFVNDPRKLEKQKAQVVADINAQLAKKWREDRLPGDAPKATIDDVQFGISTTR